VRQAGREYFARIFEEAAIMMKKLSTILWVVLAVMVAVLALVWVDAAVPGYYPLF
jgi:hypothetical protein